jgi:ubiquinone/menaquinone biosynthesis C-methylase UbiE
MEVKIENITTLNKINNYDWPADKYAIGAFIQHTISNGLMEDFAIYPDDNLLDIGCGDGSYTLKLAENISNGNVTAIDLSSNMLEIAKSRLQGHKNITFIKKNALNLDYKDSFSVVTALWSLRWIHDLNSVFHGIYNALQKNGRFFAIMPHHDGVYMRIFHKILASHKFKSLDNFVVSASYITLEEIKQILEQIPFTQSICEYRHYALELPGLEIFNKFVNGVGFFQGQVPEDDILLINDEMTTIFANECSDKYAGKYIFADDYIVINIVK